MFFRYVKNASLTTMARTPAERIRSVERMRPYLLGIGTLPYP